MSTITINEAYHQAMEAAYKRGVPEGQRHMVACLAVKDAMEDTKDNAIALRDIMREYNEHGVVEQLPKREEVVTFLIDTLGYGADDLEDRTYQELIDGLDMDMVRAYVA